MLDFTRGLRHYRRVIMGVLSGVALTLAFLLVPLGGSASALAATLSTPYPAMAVQAGQTVNIDLSVSDSVTQRLDLSVQDVPEGWKATILGAGRPISAVMTNPSASSTLELQVVVPADAAENTYTLKVIAHSAATSITLPISLTVSKDAGGTTTLDAEYASLRGPAAAKFTFSLTLKNASQQPRTYNLSASGPENWTISLKPSGSSQETPTVSVQAQGQQDLTLEVTPSSDVEIGTYDLNVTAAGGGETVSAPLRVEITGTYTLTLTTPDGNLNASVKAGSTTRTQFVLTNSGTGPLQGIKLSATAPANWEVAFEPSAIDLLPAGQQTTVIAVFTPAKDAIAGDYVVTMSAEADQAAAQSDIRVTVKTSTLWGVVGVLIAIAAIAILGFVFRRYGHR